MSTPADTLRCDDPECRGHSRAHSGKEDGRTDAYAVLPPRSTPDLWEWADRINGKQYGYPACCIEDFIADVKAGHSPGGTRWQEFPALNRCPTARPDLYLGYVPCRACARRLLGIETEEVSRL